MLEDCSPEFRSLQLVEKLQDLDEEWVEVKRRELVETVEIESRFWLTELHQRTDLVAIRREMSDARARYRAEISAIEARRDATRWLLAPSGERKPLSSDDSDGAADADPR